MGACCGPLPHGDDSIDNLSIESQSHRLIWVRIASALIISGWSMVVGLAVNLSPPTGQERWILHGLLAQSVLWVAWLIGGPLFRAAYRQLRHARPGVESLFVLGISGAFAASLHSSLTGTGAVFYEVVAILLSIHAVGRQIGAKHQTQARHVLNELDEGLLTATRVDGTRVAVASLEIGAEVSVNVGEVIPVDGVVTLGDCHLDESALTGEAFSQPKHPGDRVWAGTRSLDGPLRIRVTTLAGERRIDEVLRSVEQARHRAPRLVRNAETMARRFFPIVVGCSLTTFFVWWWIGNWETALFNALAVLLVACPCALGLATPIAVWGAFNRLHRLGITPHDGELIERLAEIDIMAFDKTGTLTELEPVPDGWSIKVGINAEDLQHRCALAQAHSLHPLGRIFCSSFSFASHPQTRLLDCQMVPGSGLRATFEDGMVLELGGEAITPEAKHGWISSEARGSARSDLPGVPVRCNGVPVAILHYRESLRPGALRCLTRLRRHGVRCVILSGDTSQRLSALNLSEVEATDRFTSLTPEDKLWHIEQLSQQGHRVAFVGDGVNDTPALAAAHCALAMQHSGDGARRLAQASLASPRLEALAEALLVCRTTVATLRGNLRFAVIYNILGMSLAAAGYLHPVAAALIMTASSATVTWRALNPPQRRRFIQHDSPIEPARAF